VNRNENSLNNHACYLFFKEQNINMANASNQPRKNNWIIWLIILLILILIGFYFFSHRNTEVTAEAASDSSTIESTINSNWSGVEEVQEQNYDEMQDSSVSVKGNDEYAVYSLDETVVFDSGKSQVSPRAEKKLQSIVSSAEKRFPNGDIRIYGYTDSVGDAAQNKLLAQSRAEAVKNWLLKNGNIKEQRISINPVGEGNPKASNGTKAGRLKNRRVEIAVRKNKSAS
jgi:outer membrane protein OmpA-like peptidoglycan-associated protein